LICRAKEQNETAMQYYQQALSLHRSAGNRNGEASTLNNIGVIHRVKGEHERALEIYEQVLRIRRELKDVSGEATTLNNMGRVFRLTNQIDLAMEYYKQSHGLLKQVGDKVNEASILSNMAMLHIEAQRWDEAERVLIETVEIDRQYELPTLEEDSRALAWVKQRAKGE
jgi:Tfp pilus assembly protein PilF